MSDYELPQHEMIIVAFEDETKADQVMTSLKGMEKMDVVDLKSGAVIVRSASGDVKIKETSDFNTKQGAIGGAVAGGIVGLLGGGFIKGALLGAAGGAAAGKYVDLGLDDDFLKAVGDSLSPGRSAIVALVDFEHLEPAMSELEQFEGGRILKHTLSDDVYRQLSEAVED